MASLIIFKSSSDPYLWNSNSTSGCRGGIRRTNLCRNMRAGSMFAEVIRTTCLISLAIILSFSKFMRPSTVESLPGGGDKTQTHKRYVWGELSTSWGGEIIYILRRLQRFDTSKMKLQSGKSPCSSWRLTFFRTESHWAVRGFFYLHTFSSLLTCLKSFKLKSARGSSDMTQ